MITISSLFIKAANRFINRMTIEQTGLYPPRYLTIHSAFDIEFKSWGNGRIRTRMSSLQVLVDLILHSSHFIRRRELISPKISSNHGGPEPGKAIGKCPATSYKQGGAPYPYWEYVCTIQGIWDKSIPRKGLILKQTTP